MWRVQPTPANYHPSKGEGWCIIDTDDGDIYEFYHTEGEAQAAFPAAQWDDYYHHAIVAPRAKQEHQRKLNILSWLFGSLFAVIIFIKLVEYTVS